MAGIWDILIPAAGTNLITNPSLETGITGTAVFFGTLSREPGGCFGIYCGKVVSDTEAVSVAVMDEVAITNGVTYTFSTYYKTDPAASAQILIIDTSGNSLAAGSALTGSTDFQRATVTYSSTASINVYPCITCDSTAILYYDGAQFEVGDTATTYIDGDQPGCYWNGTKHASTSTRKATERSGGVWTDLTDLGVHVTGSFGLGIADHQVTISEHSLRDGGEVRNVRTPSSNFTLNVSIDGTSLSDLHSKRQTFINYLNPNRYGKKNSSPVYLRYRGGAKNIIIKAYQEGGLTFSRSGGDGFTENAGIRFIREEDTLAREVGNSAVLDYNDELTPAATNTMVVQRVNGAWSKPGSLNATVIGLDYGPDGTLYLGGTFADTATTLNHIAKYNGDTFVPLGARGVNGDVNAVKSDWSGNIYFGGDFTASEDVSPIELRRVAKYNGDTISALGAGFTDGTVRALALDASGNLYAAGSFTADSDGKELRRVAKLAAGADTWSSLGAGFSDGTVYALAVDPSGNLYAGGTFTADSDGQAFPGSFAKLASGSDTWVAITGVGDTSDGSFAIRALEATPDGSVYIGGEIAGTGYSHFAKYNGNAVVAPSDTYPTDIVFGLRYNPHDGLLYVGSLNDCHVFNGRNLSRSDLSITVTSVACIAVQDDKIALGGYIDGLNYCAHINTVTVAGSGSAYPKLSLVGTTSLVFYWLENQTTGERIYLNLSVLNGETVTIDFAANSIVSSFGRNLYSTILSGSDFGSFHLAPGANSISAFGTGTGTAVLSWTEREVGL